MIDETQIEGIEKNLTKLLKEVANKKDKLPDYHPLYCKLVELTEEVAVHSEYGKFPEKLFKTKAPNEDPEEFKYRKGIYEPRTLSFWNRALSVINRIWNEQNNSIEWQEGEIFGEIPKDFFYRYFPEEDDIRSYFRSIVTPFKIKDPNAVLLVIPEIPLKQTEEGSVPDQTELITPEPCIFPMPRVVYFEDYLITLAYEKSEILVAGKKEKKGFVYWLVDETNYWKITQTGKQTDWTFNTELFYEHNLGYIPAKFLKGKPCEKDDQTFYHSYFMDAVPYLNIATRNGSNLDMCTYSHAFPERWEFVEDCPGEDGFPCILGQCGDGSEKHQCSTCKGTGKLYKHSPLGVFELKQGDVKSSLNPGDTGIPTPPFGYVEPSSDILVFLEKRVKNDIIDAFTFMNIDVSNSDVNGASDTALKAKIDREELFSFIMTISNELFDLLRFTIKACGQLRYQDKFEEPTIKAPTDFSIRSEADLTEEIGTAKTSGVPDIAIRRLIKSFMDIRFNATQDINQIADIILTIDRLATKSNLEIGTMISLRTAARWEAVLHDSISIFIAEKLAGDKDYLNKEISVIKTDMVTMAKTLDTEINPVVNSTNSILDLANGGGAMIGDQLGKLPLGIQQLSLSLTRAHEINDISTMKLIRGKLRDLIGAIDIPE